MTATSFNPCCRGLGSETLFWDANSVATVEVSILVVVDWVQRPDGRTRTARARLGFQSLLSWIGFRDFEVESVKRAEEVVSILVVVDWVQRHRNSPGSIVAACSVSILVVVDWVQRLLLVAAIAASIHVSILVVVDWVQRPPTAAAGATQLDIVSILVVVDWVQRLFRGITFIRPGSCFNPCCRGLGSETSRCEARLRTE